MKGIALILFIVLTATASAKTPSYRCIVKIGDICITSKQLNLQRSIDSVYNTSINTVSSSILHLINNAFETAVLKKFYHLSAHDSTLRRIANWINSNTRDTSRLRQVQDVFKNDRDEYLQMYVMPVTVNPRLYDMFYSDTIIHKVSRSEMVGIRSKIINDLNSFERFDGYDTLTIPKYALIKKQLGAYYDESVPNPLIEKVLKNLKPGGIWTDVVEDDRTYMMIKLIAETDSTYFCSVIRRDKVKFDSWFRKYVLENIAITFYDRDLYNKIRTSYPDLWWVWSVKVKR